MEPVSKGGSILPELAGGTTGAGVIGEGFRQNRTARNAGTLLGEPSVAVVGVGLGRITVDHRGRPVVSIPFSKSDPYWPGGLLHWTVYDK